MSMNYDIKNSEVLNALDVEHDSQHKVLTLTATDGPKKLKISWKFNFFSLVN